MKERYLLLGGALSAMTVFPDGLSAAEAPEKMNVLFIVVDDLGWKDTGCYGSSFYKTPNVDRLAELGMRFTDAYSANPLCSPTRSSILTGQYPVRTGFTAASGHTPGKHTHHEVFEASPDQRAAGPTSLNYLPDEYYTLGEAMHDAGYATAFLGKWHMGRVPYTPESNGFDFVVGGRCHPGPPGLDPKRKYYPPWDKTGTLPEDAPDDLHIDDYLGTRAVEFINEHKNQPFFMCFWLYDVHAPFQSKPEYIEKWKGLADPSNPQHCPTMAAMVEVMDDNVGRVLNALKDNGIEDNTVVIFTSDNGGNMYDVADGTTRTDNRPLRSGKGNSYEGGVRIPLIVRWPGVTAPGSVCSSVISTVDHYPSILEMTGQELRPDDHKDGVSYVPALRGEAFDRGPTICDFTHFVPATMNIPNTWVRVGDWKLLNFWFDGSEQVNRYELYNVKNDPGETRNLAAQHPEKVQELSRMINEYYQQSGSCRTNPNKKYNHCTVGVWSAAGEGRLSAKDGALVLKAAQPQFAAQTRVTPSLVSTAQIEFEVRSDSSSPVDFQWTSSGVKQFGAPEQSRSIEVSKDWKPVRMEIEFKGRIGKLRFALPEAGGAEFRNIRLLTPDGSLITSYEFY